jgi:hypothetical protein
MRVKRHAYRILLGKSEGNSILENPGHREKVRVKAIPARAWPGPGVSMTLRLPDFKTIGTLRW